ncbi:hypothetical protein ACLB2K_035957 [Fragaria x ananassa]
MNLLVGPVDRGADLRRVQAGRPRRSRRELRYIVTGEHRRRTTPKTLSFGSETNAEFLRTVVLSSDVGGSDDNMKSNPPILLRYLIFLISLRFQSRGLLIWTVVMLSLVRESEWLEVAAALHNRRASGKVKMSNVGTSKGVLEIAKFGLYVAIPIVLMYTFANNSKNIKKFMGNRSYIVYPPEAPRPPSPEEMREMARELARKNNAR